mmetsp:Transcript_9511/g.43258  ORF Transcript_9511/g.43258 Transcript_9511/m.43258 type:complete len:218 (+) Transcript_9511:728-1381(+)
MSVAVRSPSMGARSRGLSTRRTRAGAHPGTGRCARSSTPTRGSFCARRAPRSVPRRGSRASTTAVRWFTLAPSSGATRTSPRFSRGCSPRRTSSRRRYRTRRTARRGRGHDGRLTTSPGACRCRRTRWCWRLGRLRRERSRRRMRTGINSPPRLGRRRRTRRRRRPRTTRTAPTPGSISTWTTPRSRPRTARRTRFSVRRATRMTSFPRRLRAPRRR